jgi:Protein of unknown function (DUF3311)
LHRWHWVRVLLIIPFVAVLWVPFYNRIGPTLWGFPFFYWYQLLWIILSVLIIGLVYLLEHRTET